MAKDYDAIPDHLAEFALEQKIFFIATTVGDDDINLSPKGVALLKIIDERTVLYADYYGSGNQTANHLAAGGKATIMFTSFDEKPLIARFFCTGKAIAKGTPEYNDLCAKLYPDNKSSDFRQLFIFDVYRAQHSCGFGTPLYEYVGNRSDEKYFEELFG